MIDKYSRNIEYLRLSVTDRCNLRCQYCLPKDIKHNFLDKEFLMTSSEIIKIVNLMSKVGIIKVRITGGEPLVRKDIYNILGSINAIDSIKETTITTNGLLLENNISNLKNAGIKRINLSLDSLNYSTYNKITNGGELSKLLKIIDELLENDISIKINSVIVFGVNDNEIPALVDLTKRLPLDVRFIELMPIGNNKNLKPVSNEFIRNKIIEENNFSLISRSKLDGPAEYIKLDNSLGRIGFISPLSNCFCNDCNKIRVTSDGFLKQCLNFNYGINLKNLIRKNKPDDEILAVIKNCIYNKPEKHHFEERTTNTETKTMNQIGG